MNISKAEFHNAISRLHLMWDSTMWDIGYQLHNIIEMVKNDEDKDVILSELEDLLEEVK